MGLAFCCPSCGENLRANPATAAYVSCPGCGEPIRVPRHPHPVETGPAAPTFSAPAVAAARAGLHRLLFSTSLFAIGIGLAAAAVGLRVATFARPPAPLPDWVLATTLLLAAGWVVLGLFGCGCRATGYARCRAAADAVGVGAWARAAGGGTWLTAVGVLAVVPWLLGRPVVTLPVEGVAVVFVGLVCGAFGMALEFAFLNVLHRLLWETAGWRAANRTSAYTLTFVFTAVAGMGSVCLGGVVSVLAFGGRAKEPGPLPAEVRWVAAGVLLALVGCAAVVVYRYAQLLVATRRALAQPEPLPGPQVPSEK
jgi:hypothetical protein